MAQAAIAYATAAEYLFHARNARDKHEYIDGELVLSYDSVAARIDGDRTRSSPS